MMFRWKMIKLVEQYNNKIIKIVFNLLLHKVFYLMYFSEVYSHFWDQISDINLKSKFKKSNDGSNVEKLKKN